MANGREFETEILADCEWSWKDGYAPYEICVKMVKENQPKNWIFHPHYYVARTLRKAVAEILNLDCSLVKFYTCLGSAFDVYHKVDCFFEVGNKRAKIDLTTDPNKYNPKADVIIYRTDVYHQEEINQEGILVKAREIAAVLAA